MDWEVMTRREAESVVLAWAVGSASSAVIESIARVAACWLGTV